MEKIWEFFENLDEFVYVADMDTYELVYMNRKTRESYGFTSNEELVGRKCYEVLQNCSAPCKICTNHELQPEIFKEWGYYSPVIDRYVLLKDTMLCEDGRRFRVEIGIDITAQMQKESIVSNYQNLEAVTNEALRVALQAETPDESLMVLLEYLGKALDGERMYIFEKNAKGGDDNTYEWAANGVSPEKDSLQNLPPEVCESWYREFESKRGVVIQNLEDIEKREPKLYQVLKRQNIHSLTVVPLCDEKKVIGFYGADNVSETSLEYAADMLEIMGHFIVSSLRRRNLVRELQRLSYSDQLTGIGNRHAMKEYVRHLQFGESIGVVFCDVTGLKKVNDNEGHKAGDKLLCRAADSLQRVFEGNGVFRIGGDEMVAFCPRITEESLKQKVEELRQEMTEHAFLMAVGVVWRKEGVQNTDKLLDEAEKKMYEEKNAYYRNSGIDRRK